MEKQFIYPADELNELFRSRTRDSDLQVSRYKKDEWLHYSDGRKIPLTETEQNEGLDKFDSRMDLTQLIIYDTFRLPIISNKMFAGIVAAEIIAFGTGLLRNAKTEQTPFEACMGEEPSPKIMSELIRIYDNHILKCNDKDEGEVVEVWESTNLILGDSYGELEQIMRRWKDKEFLTRYISAVRRITEVIEIPEFTFYENGKQYHQPSFSAPRCLAGGFGYDFVMTHEAHRKYQQIWTEPPKIPEELLGRAEFVLSKIIIDNLVTKVRTKYKHQSLLSDDEIQAFKKWAKAVGGHIEKKEDK